MADTGFKSPSSNGELHSNWTSAISAYSSNDSYATITTTEDPYLYHSYENFNFGVPAGATILGIEYKIEGHVNTGATYCYVRIMKGGVEQGLVGQNFTDTDQTFTGGGATSLFNTTWTADDFSDANFNIEICPSGATPGRTMYVDHLQVKVYYSPTSISSSPSQSTSPSTSESASPSTSPSQSTSPSSSPSISPSQSTSPSTSPSQSTSPSTSPSASPSPGTNHTLKTKGNTTFAKNDILRIKDGINDEWLRVTGVVSASEYFVERDLGAAYSSNLNPGWKKGATIVNYGQSGAGGIYMTASDSNAPYLSVFDHAGSPWSAINTRLRVGNLNGYLGYSSDLYGIAIGETDAYLKYDPTNGLRIKGNLTATTGEIGGFSIGADYVRDAANSFGLASTVSAGSDIRFWAGDTFANRSTAPFRIDEDGNAVVKSLRRDDFHFFTIFESIDGYTTTAGGTGSVTLSGQYLTIATGTTTNDLTTMARSTSSGLTGRSFSFPLSFMCSLRFASVTNVEAFVGIGNVVLDAGGPGNGVSIGFYLESGTLYGLVSKSGTYDTCVMGTPGIDTDYMVSCVWNPATYTANFILEFPNGSRNTGSVTLNSMTLTATAHPVALEIKTKTTAAKTMYVYEWDFWRGTI